VPKILEMNRISREQEDQSALTFRGARRIVGLVLLLLVIWVVLRALESIVLLFAVVFLLAAVLNPAVVWLERRKVPRGAAVAIVVLALLAVVVTIVLFAIPPLANQVEGLIRSAPASWQSIRAKMISLAQSYPSVRDALPQTDEIAGQIGTAAGAVGNVVLKSTIGFVGGVLSVALALLVLVFVLINPQPLVAGYLALAPARYHDTAYRTLARMMRQMQAWARGVAINGCITGVSIGVGLWLIGIQPALMFGAFAFLGEFLPNIGAFLVSIPILFLALSMGATKFWLALGLIVLVYQVELNLLVPVVLGKEMRLHPVNILFFTLAMASLFGLLGAILAVPAAALVQIVIDEFYLRPRQLDYDALEREAAELVRGRAEKHFPSLSPPNDPIETDRSKS
jgi:predicted PurR-regulated permease PerM